MLCCGPPTTIGAEELGAGAVCAEAANDANDIAPAETAARIILFM
jgi:hypothetical protein